MPKQKSYLQQKTRRTFQKIDRFFRKFLNAHCALKNKINMNVDEHLYNHFQSLTPAQQKAIQDLMLLKILQDFND